MKMIPQAPMAAHELFCFFFIIFLILSCNGGGIKRGKTVNPIMKMEVVSIPSPASVKVLTGEIFLKQKGQNKYDMINDAGLITYGDILEVRKGGSVVVLLNNGKSFNIGPVDKNSWFYFEKRP